MLARYPTVNLSLLILGMLSAGDYDFPKSVEYRAREHPASAFKVLIIFALNAKFAYASFAEWTWYSKSANFLPNVLSAVKTSNNPFEPDRALQHLLKRRF